MLQMYCSLFNLSLHFSCPTYVKVYGYSSARTSQESRDVPVPSPLFVDNWIGSPIMLPWIATEQSGL